MPKSKKNTHRVFLVSFLTILGVILVLTFSYIFLRVFNETSSKQKDQVEVNKLKLEELSLEEKMQLSEEEWQDYLTKNQFLVLRKKGTEFPYTGALLGEKRSGTYVTADCGEPVFRSEQKYDSQTGWPSFWAPIDENSVELVSDTSEGLERTEVVSKKCKSHLGHVFDDGPEPTGKRFCINSAALVFIPDEE